MKARVRWTPSEDAAASLVREGVPPSRIEQVGSVLNDSYHSLAEPMAKAGLPERLGSARGQYAVITLRRPVNVDGFASLSLAVAQLVKLAKTIAVVFPVNPRTKKQPCAVLLWEGKAALRIVESLQPRSDNISGRVLPKC